MLRFAHQPVPLRLSPDRSCMFDDRRKKQRRLANLTGLVRAGQDVDSVVTTDVSASGAFVATRLQLREGDEVELQLRDTLK